MQTPSSHNGQPVALLTKNSRIVITSLKKPESAIFQFARKKLLEHVPRQTPN